MEYIATRVGRRGPTHKQEATRLYGRFVNAIVAKADLADMVIEQNHKLEKLEAKLPDMVKEALTKALEAREQPLAVEDGSLKG